MNRRVYGLDPSITSTGISDGVTHSLIKTLPEDSISPLGDTARRLAVIMLQIETIVNQERDRNFIIYVESAMLNSTQANHLYEMGMYFISLYNMFSEHRLRFISPATLKKYISGKGNAGKSHVATVCGVGKHPLCVTCAARDIHHITFEHDPGKDKLHAFFLFKLGTEIESGYIPYIAPVRRGRGKE